VGQQASDVLRGGQRLLCYVREVDLERGRIKLTRFRPKDRPRVPI